jgi:hypothetical protein
MRQAGGLVALVIGIGCGSSTETAPPIEQAKNSYQCRKVTGGPGHGRACVGPGYSFTGLERSDVFETDVAWCVTQRVSWTNPRSRMRCVPTEDECRRDLLITSAGKENIFVRSDCTQTAPAAWAPNEAPYSRPDGFVCDRASGEAQCKILPAELMKVDEMPRTSAWCLEGPDKGQMFNLRCYELQTECSRARSQSSTDESCVLLTAAYAIESEYGELSRRR